MKIVDQVMIGEEGTNMKMSKASNKQREALRRQPVNNVKSGYIQGVRLGGYNCRRSFETTSWTARCLYEVQPRSNKKETTLWTARCL